MSGTPSDAKIADYRRRIRRVLIHVQHNLDAALSLEKLASIAVFSPFHFHRVFRGMVGESVMQHVRRLRLERAAMRLRHTARPVTDIAFEAGYEAHESFTRAFRVAFGCSPSEFRSSTDPHTHLQAPSGTHFAAVGETLEFTPLTETREDPMDVDVRHFDPMRVAYLRHTGPYDGVAETWERLMDWAGARGVLGPDTRWFGACHDDPEITAPDHLRYDACVTIDPTVTVEDPIGEHEIPGGRFAVTLHVGPYERLSATYAALFGRWFPASGREPGDPPCLELYLNEPDATPPEELLTEIRVRIADAHGGVP